MVRKWGLPKSADQGPLDSFAAIHYATND